MEDLGLLEFVYECLFAGVQLVCYALRERHEFDEKEVEARGREFRVVEVVNVWEDLLLGGW